MKYGIREICNVVLRAKTYQKIGTMKFQKDMPVLYFDSLKTSSLEGAATTVYAQGGRGNTRLIAWEGEKTVTFTMEDALISPVSLAVLSGAGVIDKSEGQDMARIKHATETTAVVKQTTTVDGADQTTTVCGVSYKPYISGEFYAYVIPLDGNGDMKDVPQRVDALNITQDSDKTLSGYEVTLVLDELGSVITDSDAVQIDYYYESANPSVTEIDIDAQNFAGNYYLEASTLWRNKYGVDVEAEFIIPNCKIQSNFTFTLAATGDPSTFTFTMDAFPDYTKYNKSKKVLCAIRLVEEEENNEEADFVGNTIDAYEEKDEEVVSGSTSYSWRNAAKATEAE